MTDLAKKHAELDQQIKAERAAHLQQHGSDLRAQTAEIIDLKERRRRLGVPADAKAEAALADLDAKIEALDAPRKELTRSPALAELLAGRRALRRQQSAQLAAASAKGLDKLGDGELVAKLAELDRGIELAQLQRAAIHAERAHRERVATLEAKADKMSAEEADGLLAVLERRRAERQKADGKG